MFDVFKKKEEKDPVCGMIASEKFISKYGEKFCSESCVKKYEVENHIANEKECGGSCARGCC
ncbi:MAG: hypothetical protein P1P85_03835 [Patescibacteria group bacterium]|nr:hypothetical protein [Patescibacteria group bacterium]